MATARHNQKQQRKGGVMYVYNLGGESTTPKPKPPAELLNSPATIKKVISGRWGALRRSKTYRENHHQEGEEAAAAGEMVVEARKSVCSEQARRSVSYLEVNVASAAAFLQVKVLVTDMPGFMQVHAFRCARQTFDSLEKFSSKHMACNLKKEFDKIYGPAWHCIVGSSFGSFVTHSTGCFLYFSMEKLYILVFKTKVQRSVD